MPPNVQFEVDDVEKEWTYSSPFDYIHCRFMSVAIRDWPRLCGQILKLSPMSDIAIPAESQLREVY